MPARKLKWWLCSFWSNGVNSSAHLAHLTPNLKPDFWKFHRIWGKTCSGPREGLPPPGDRKFSFPPCSYQAWSTPDLERSQ